MENAVTFGTNVRSRPLPEQTPTGAGAGGLAQGRSHLFVSGPDSARLMAGTLEFNMAISARLSARISGRLAARPRQRRPVACRAGSPVGQRHQKPNPTTLPPSQDRAMGWSNLQKVLNRR